MKKRTIFLLAFILTSAYFGVGSVDSWLRSSDTTGTVLGEFDQPINTGIVAQNEVIQDSETAGVVKAVEDEISENSLVFRLKIYFLEAIHGISAKFDTDLEVGNDVLIGNDTDIAGDLTVAGTLITEDELVAPNVVYSILAGDGITVTGTQDITITNDDLGSSQLIFKNFKIGDNTITAGSNDDTLTWAGANGVSLSNDGKTITISASGSELNVSGWTDDGSTVRLTTSTDNVGIGTTDATAKLYVLGNSIINGNLSVLGTTTVLSGFNNSGGGITNAGAITGATGFTSSGQITFSGLGNGMIFSNSSGVLSSSSLNLATGDANGYLTGALPTANGGTGLAGYTIGDILYASATNTLASLGIGATNEVLTVSGGVPVWASITGGSGICPNCLVDDPGTTQTITPTASTAIGLVVKQASAGSVDTFRVESFDGADVYFKIDSSGNVTLGNQTSSGVFTVSPASTDPISLSPVAQGDNQYTGTITSEDLTANRTWTFPNSSGIVCLASGNCSGTSASIGGSGTTNYITKWDGTFSVTDSLLYDNGTNVGVGTTVPTGKLSVVSSGNQYGATIHTTHYGLLISSDDNSDTRRLLTLQNLAGGTPGGGTDKLVVLANGNVGIGTNAPTSALQVSGATTLSSTLNVTGATTLSATLDVTGAITTGGNLSVNGTGNSYFSGNVGIGTSAPLQQLHIGKDQGAGKLRLGYDPVIYPTVYSEIYDSGSGAGLRISNFYNCAACGITFDTAGAVDPFKITNSGNVGIGTTAPEKMLHVSGGAILLDFGQPLIGESSTPGTYYDLVKVGSGNNVTVGSTSQDTRIQTANVLIFSPGTDAWGVYSSQIVPLGSSNSKDFGSTTNSLRSGYFGTSLFSPILYGGTGASSTLTLAGTNNGSPSSADIILNGTGQGNVGIGTTTPTGKLEINLAGGTAGGKGLVITGGGTPEPTMEFRYPAYPTSSFRMVAGSYRLQFKYNTGTDAVPIWNEGFSFSKLGGIMLGSSYVATDPGSGNMIVSGSVGIGTTNPGSKLHLHQTFASTNAVETMLRIDRQTSGSAAAGMGSRVLFRSYAGASDAIMDSAAIDVSAYSVGAGHTANLSFQTNLAGNGLAERMSIRAGVVVVGASTVSTHNNGLLQVLTNAGSTTIGNQVLLKVGNSNTTNAAGGKSEIGFSNGGLGNHVVLGTELISAGGSYESDFYIGTKTTATNVTERFRITGAGNVGIGSTAPGQALDVVGNARFSAVGSDAYASDLHLTADGTLTTAASDIRLKENLVELSDSEILNKVLDLKTYQFNWKNGGASDLGMVAQEVENIFPELTFTNKVDGYMGINYSRIPTLLISAVQEQQKLLTGLSIKLDQFGAVTSQATQSGATNQTQATQAQASDQFTYFEQLLNNSVVFTDSIWNFVNEVVFTATTKFLAGVEFAKSVAFNGEVAFSKESAGTAVVPAGTTLIKVSFDRTFTQEPNVYITNKGVFSSEVTVSEITKEYFVLRFREANTNEVAIQWLAILAEQTDQARVQVLEFQGAAITGGVATDVNAANQEGSNQGQEFTDSGEQQISDETQTSSGSAQTDFVILGASDSATATGSAQLTD